MEKIDFKKQYKNLFNPSSKEFSLADVPEFLFLMVDGQGDPNTSQSYKDAIQALYPVAYKLKFASKENPGKDYTVAPLEGLWCADDMAAFTNNDRDEWKWTLMIMQPEWISEKMFRDARNAVLKKDLPALDKIRFERFREGLSVQIMHIGSYADEAPVIERLHKEWLPQNGYIENGKHHEIYLSDPRKVAPEKLKTILRQPVKNIRKVMKVSVYIAVSMDGFIARENGDLDWLPGIEGFAGESEYEEDYGYNAFIESVDVIVMGRSTFEKVMHFDPWPYKNKRLIVLSSSLSTIPGNVPDTVELLNKTPEKILELLEHQKVKHVYLDGGRTIQSFLNAGLVDELIVTRIPVLIGQGIPLFGRLKKDIQLQHFETAAYKNGLVQSCYHVKNQD